MPNKNSKLVKQMRVDLNATARHLKGLFFTEGLRKVRVLNCTEALAMGDNLLSGSLGITVKGLKLLADELLAEATRMVNNQRLDDKDKDGGPKKKRKLSSLETSKTEPTEHKIKQISRADSKKQHSQYLKADRKAEHEYWHNYGYRCQYDSDYYSAKRRKTTTDCDYHPSREPTWHQRNWYSKGNRSKYDHNSHKR